ncbi:MAG: hypothetical protein ABR511_03350 [Acidimicrobiales bacterium]
MSTLRRNLYRAARIMGDVQAAAKGPGPLGKRLARKAVYRRTGRGTRRILRIFGL